MPTRKKTENASPNPEISIAKIGLISAIVVALLGTLGTVISAYFSSRAAQAPIVIPLQATQTQEARLLAQLPTETSASASNPLPTSTPPLQPPPTELPSLQPSPTNQPAAQPLATSTPEQVVIAVVTDIPPDIPLPQLEHLLTEANLGLSSTRTREGIAAMRTYFTGPDSAYQMLAIASLQVVGAQRLKQMVYLDMIDAFYTDLVGGEDNYLTADGKLDLEQVKEAIVKAYIEYYGEYVSSFDKLLEPRG